MTTQLLFDVQQAVISSGTIHKFLFHFIFHPILMDFFLLTKWSLLWIFDETSFYSYFNSKRLSNSEISYIWKVHLYMDFFLKLIVFVGTYRSMSCSWSYGSWIYNYLCNQCLSSLTLWVRIPSLRGVLNTTSCDKICQWLAEGRWFSPDTQVSSTNKTDRQDITEILWKVTLNTITISHTKRTALCS